MTTAGLRRSQARGLRETGPDGTGVAQVVPEGSEALQQGPELTIGPGLARPGREPAGRQRRDPAPRIGEGAACDLGLSAERGVVLEQGRPIVVDEHLQRHAELAAVGEHRLMVLRDARRARVQVEVGLPIPLHPLARIRLRDRVPRADRPDAASRPVTRFEDGALVAGSLELVGGRHPGDAGPEHGDPDASTGILRQASRPAVGDRGSDDPHRAQGAVQRGRATIPADQVEEPSAVDSRHASVASGDIVSQSPTIQGTLLHALPAASPRGRAIMPPPRTAAPLNVPVPRPDTTRLQRLAHSYRAAAALMAAVELGLFTRVARGADTEAAVAQALDLTTRSGWSPRAWPSACSCARAIACTTRPTWPASWSRASRPTPGRGCSSASRTGTSGGASPGISAVATRSCSASTPTASRWSRRGSTTRRPTRSAWARPAASRARSTSPAVGRSSTWAAARAATASWPRSSTRSCAPSSDRKNVV